MCAYSGIQRLSLMATSTTTAYIGVVVEHQRYWAAMYAVSYQWLVGCLASDDDDRFSRSFIDVESSRSHRARPRGTTYWCVMQAAVDSSAEACLHSIYHGVERIVDDISLMTYRWSTSMSWYINSLMSYSYDISMLYMAIKWPKVA